MPLPDDLATPLSREWPRLAPLVSRVKWVASAGSTMDLAQALAGQSGEGLLVIADEQTSGRGRRGRAWSSPPGAGLYFSVLVRPPASPTVLTLLTLAAGVGVVDGVSAATGLQAQLKWPNDVLVGRRKLAGILAEGVAVGTPEPTVVLGVGVNVAAASLPSDLARQATSVETELGRAVDRGEVLAHTLAGIAEWYRALLEARYDEVLRAWRSAAPSAVGTMVEWTTALGTQRGVTAGIDEAGALLVRTQQGIERLIAGEIAWGL